MAAVICVVMGAWAVAFARAESEKGCAASTDTAVKTTAAVSADAVSAQSGSVTATSATASASTGTPVFQMSDLFSDRDLKQEADLTDAVTYTVTDGQNVSITDAGVYVLTGEARDVTVVVEAGEKDKVQLVLDGLSVTNGSAPVIYVKSADKVFVTVAGDSALAVTGTFTSDGDTHTDGVIFSKADLTLNGTAALTLTSSENGVVGKDDLKITGGTYVIRAQVKAIDANDSIRVSGGTLDLTAGTDGLHAENDDDDAKGYIYIGGGALTITAGDDGLHAATVVQMDEGALTISAAEGIEGTYVQLNGGVLSITARDDGVNAAQKSSAYRATVEINGGDITIAMGSGDTDGVDSNGDIVVNGGVIRVTGSSTFDYDGTGTYNGGTIIVNGQQIDYIPNQFGGGMGGMGGPGGFGGRGGWGGHGGH